MIYIDYNNKYMRVLGKTFHKIKIPKRATYLLNNNHPTYKIRVIHFDTRLITLQESKKSFNTVNMKNVQFDFTGFTEEDKDKFMSMFRQIYKEKYYG